MNRRELLLSGLLLPFGGKLIAEEKQQNELDNNILIIGTGYDGDSWDLNKNINELIIDIKDKMEFICKKRPLQFIIYKYKIYDLAEQFVTVPFKNEFILQFSR